MLAQPLTQAQQDVLTRILADALNHYGTSLNGLGIATVRECLQWVAEESAELLTDAPAVFVQSFNARKP